MHVLLAAAGLAVVLLLFRQLDWTATRAYLARLGVRAPLLLIPYLGVLVFDTAGWRALLQPPARPPSFLRLLGCQTAVEALLGSLPAGIAVGESLRVLLLRRHAGMSTPAAAANTVVVKLGIALAQGVFLAAAAAVMLGLPGTRSGGPAGHVGGRGFGLALALGFVGAMGGALWFLARGRVFSRTLAASRRLGGERWRARLARLEAPMAQVDAAFALFARLPVPRMAAALGAFMAAWFCLALEDWLIFAVLGATGVSFSIAVSMQATVSLVRIAFFYLPGGVGAQEASYYGLLVLYGVPDAEAVAAAFVIAKRAKELFWIAVGYLVWGLLPSNGERGPLIGRSGDV